MSLVTTSARAYVNYGRWIADCPRECGFALKLDPQQGTFHCRECGLLTGVDWPSNADDIWNALGERPAPRNRNWFPQSHPLALRAGLPHGQSVDELRAEAREHEGE